MRKPIHVRVALVLVSCFAAFAGGCGALTPPADPAPGDGVDRACLDIWSLAHFAAGYYLGQELDDPGFVDIEILLIDFEFIEPHFWPGWDESMLNQNCDVVVGTLGWLFESLAQ